MTHVRGLIEALLDLVLPRSCAGCATPGTQLCARCVTALAGSTAAVLADGPRRLPPLAAAGSYGGALRAVLLAHKEHGRLELVGPLGVLLAASVAALHPRPGTVLVPVPSSRRAVRARGHDHARRLAAAAAGRLGVPAMPLLRQVRPVADSAGLSAAERAANLRGALAAHPPPAGAPVVVVDDVVTTGATLREAVRALRAAGADVRGAAVVAATPRLRPTRAGPPRGPPDGRAGGTKVPGLQPAVRAGSGAG